MNEDKDQKGFRQDGSKTDDRLPENSQERLKERLDEAVEETFPASDPVSVHITK